MDRWNSRQAVAFPLQDVEAFELNSLSPRTADFPSPDVRNTGQSRPEPRILTIDNGSKYSVASSERELLVERSISNEPPTGNGRLAPWRFRHGWRIGLLAASALGLIVLVINTIVLVYLVSHYPVQSGIGTIYAGSCSIVNARSRWLHIGINALSSALLAASNYCMQVVYAPTRSDVDAAHAQGNWLDIGVMGFRNLKHIHYKRRMIWVTLVLSSLPVHLLYNAAILKVQEDRSYAALVVSGLDFNGTDADARARRTAPVSRVLEALAEGQASNSSRFLHETVDQCYQYYAGDHFIVGRDVALTVTLAEHSKTGEFGGYDHEHEQSLQSLPVIWNDQSSSNYPWLSSDSVFSSNAQHWYVHEWPIEYCLSQLTPETCELQFNARILIVVVICGVLKVAAMISILLIQDQAALVTIGDAVASFLRHPDPHTAGMCLFSKADAKWSLHWLVDGKRQHPVRWDSVTFYRARWWKALSESRRVFLIYFHFTCWLAVAVALPISVISTGSGTSLWSLNFGEPNPNALIPSGLPRGSGGVIGAAVIANLPQLLLSVLNVACNNFFTTVHLCLEWSGYALSRKGLRVSCPTGAQRSTYWLQLPFRFSIPLIILWTTLHWLASQSFFLVRINSIALNGVSSLSNAAAFSGLSIICFIALDGALILAMIGMGWRRFPSRMPVAGNCSVAISAACHPHEDEIDSYMEWVQWGAVPLETSKSGLGAIGHCSFSSKAVFEPEEGKLYAGISRTTTAKKSQSM